MGLGVSILLIALGAILAFAVEKSPEGLNVNTVGWILMAVGVVGLLLTLLFWESWWGRRGFGYRQGYGEVPETGATRYAYRRRAAAPRRAVVEHEVVEDVGPPPDAPPPPPPPP